MSKFCEILCIYWLFIVVFNEINMSHFPYVLSFYIISCEHKIGIQVPQNKNLVGTLIGMNKHKLPTQIKHAYNFCFSPCQGNVAISHGVSM